MAAFSRSLVVGSGILVATSAHAFFLDGNGYFGMRGETRYNPEFQKNKGTYQATELSLDLNGEVRANDRASFNLRLGIDNGGDSTYLGDTAKPTNCETRRSSTGGESDSTCSGRHQSTTDQGYADYKPVIREAYAKYAFNYCLLTAGRRSRDVGLGILYSSGKKPFETDPSVFDGVTCDVNIQKQQDLGFTFGVDKLQETGTWIDNPYDNPSSNSSYETGFNNRGDGSFGANQTTDDMEQLFFGITYDDLKSKNPGSFAKQVGIYFSNILGSESKTDVKFFDLYMGLYFGKLSLRNEAVFRMGKTADPNIASQGGKRSGSTLVSQGGTYTSSPDPVVNNVQSIGVAGQLDYVFSRSGASLGPTEFNEGNATKHTMFLTYAYAPGDADGYYEDRAGTADEMAAVGEVKRNQNAKAMAFHKNYKPALLMFNGKATSKYLNRGGVFNSQRVMNAALYSLGYRYDSQESGNFEVKLITGRLIEKMPDEVKSWYDARPSEVRPVGYNGSLLGYELDLMYGWQYRREVEFGIGAAVALPGNAWEISGDKPTTQLGLLGSFALKF